MKVITQENVAELLKTKRDGSLFHREQKDLEFKESFNLGGLAEYFKDFAGFANNSGGFIVFGVTNSPRRLKGLLPSSLSQFTKIDEEMISGFINDHFSPYMDWEMDIVELKGMKFGVFYIHRSNVKPVICKKGDDRHTLKNGEVYYRYAGRTEVIQFSELSFIIEERVKKNNDLWISKVKRIGEVGPANVGLLDTVNGIVEGDRGTLLIDNDLIKEISFIREGEFNERKGAKTLKLIGSVQPIDTVEIAKIVKRRITDEYPYSYTKLEKILKTRNPKIRVDKIQKIIKEGDLKNDSRYSVYNFRNKDQEENYASTGIIPKGTPSIYNDAAVEYVLKIFQRSK